MSYWDLIPRAVLKSKKMTDGEKLLYAEIEVRAALNVKRCCDATNSELAKEMGISEKTISARLTSMERKKCINVYYNPHTHKRYIYVNYPGREVPERPEGKEVEEMAKPVIEAMKKALILGELDMNVLVQKMIESPYLEKVKNNTYQFCLTKEQIKFLVDFEKFTQKEIDCQIASYQGVDYNALLKGIQASKFILQSKNLNLKWCLEHYQDIIADKYKYTNPTLSTENVNKQNFVSRKYTDNELNSLFQEVDEIEV